MAYIQLGVLLAALAWVMWTLHHANRDVVSGYELSFFDRTSVGLIALTGLGSGATAMFFAYAAWPVWYASPGAAFIGLFPLHFGYAASHLFLGKPLPASYERGLQALFSAYKGS